MAEIGPRRLDEVEQLAWSKAFYPLTGNPIHCPHSTNGYTGRAGRWNGVSSNTRCLYNDEIYYVEFLFLEGDLRDAMVTVDDVAANRRVLDCAPAWLYAKPPAPQIRREVNEEIVVFQWPPDQPVTHRLPPCLIGPQQLLAVRLDNVAPQDDPIGVVFLCRRPSEHELARTRGR